MKIECHTREFLEAVNLVAGVVSSNTTRPILHSVLISAESEQLVIQGTDMEVGLAVRVDGVEVSEPGKIAIPAVLGFDLRQAWGATHTSNQNIAETVNSAKTR